MRPSLILVILAASIGAHAQIFSDYDTGADWKKYKTYAWLAPGDTVLNRYRNDKLYGGLIVHTANQEIKAKGMRPDTLRPDAIFVFHTKVQDQVQYSQSPTLSVGVSVAGPGYYVGGGGPVAGGKITAHPYEDGTLVYEMYDGETGSLVWRGGDQKKFEMKDDIQALIVKTTKKIFKKLPIKHKN
jgi:hypothetical protein